MIKFTSKVMGLAFMLGAILSCNKSGDVVKATDAVLNEGWQFRQADSSQWLPATVPGTVHTDLLANNKIADPFYRTNERDLQWIDKKDWEYQTTLKVDAETAKRDNIELFFEGLDTYADVYVNDSLVLSANNMFREWTANIKPYVKEGDNSLRLYFHSPISKGLAKLEAFGYGLPAANDQSKGGGLEDKKVSVFTRKAGYHYGWDWGPRFVTSGIWRPVHLRAWNNARINSIQVIQHHVSKEKADLSVVFEVIADRDGEATVAVSSVTDAALKGEGNIVLKKGLNKATVALAIENPKLWWTNGLGEANLYSLTGALNFDGETVDEKETTIGIRTVKIIQAPDSLGKSFYVELNGVPVFMKGANYIPNDNFLTRVSNEVYDKVVGAAVNTNMNMLRVWGGGIYENKYFYDLCDKRGILVWQDFMFACSMYPGDEEFLENVKQEAIDNVKRLRNHASVGLWCGNNEIDVAWQQFKEEGGWGWKQKYTAEQREQIWKAYDAVFNKILPEVVNEYHPGTFYWPSSPMADFDKHSDFAAHAGDIHYWDVWWGQKPFAEYKTQVGRFMSEYGFQSFPEFKTVKAYTVPEDWDIFSEVMQAHQRSSIGNGTIKNYMQRDYKVPADFQQFLYVGQILQAEGIKVAMEAHRRKMPYCMGTLFWQINDCWPVASWSSTDYYGRWKAQQYFTAKAFTPVLVSPDVEGDQLKVYVVSDLLENKKAELQLRILSFDGKLLFEKVVPVDIKANTSDVYYTENVNSLVPAAARKTSLLSVKVVENNQVLSSNILYLLPPKDLTLPKAVVKQSLKEENGQMVLSLTSDKLVKNLFLSTEEGDGFFSDNYFDILPGETVTVTFKPSASMDIKAFESNLRMMNLSEI